MFACLHAPGNLPLLIECAEQFSPRVEQLPPDTVLFDVHGLQSLIGTPHQIAQSIANRAGIPASIAIAPDPDTASFAVLGKPGITVIARGEEAAALAPLPVNLLMASPEICETFDQWGIRTFGELARLPPLGIAARLGDEGVRLWRLSRGEGRRLLRPELEPVEYREVMELEHPVELLEPLSFLLSRMLTDLCARLTQRSLATDRLCLQLALENAPEHSTTLRFPVPLRDSKTLLKLLQLELHDHPPAAPVIAIRLQAEPVKPRIEQHGLFVPLSPEPRQMEITLARLTAVVGEGRVGTPELLDAHRPDAFQLVRFTSAAVANAPVAAPGTAPPALRRIRPPWHAQVQLRNGKPVRVSALQVQGTVEHCAGPWNTSGEWWKPTAWDHDEWDVALSTGGMYRIYCDRQTNRWFVEGTYD